MITITEALARLKTITKQIDAKRAFVVNNLARQRGLVDPHERAGGSPKVVAEALQSIRDLESRRLQLRVAINAANRETSVTVGGATRTIEEWLIWRRDILGPQRARLQEIVQRLQQTRNEAAKKGFTVVGQTVAAGEALTDVLVNVDELAIQQEIEQIEEVAGTLDGLLSLKNATVTVKIDG